MTKPAPIPSGISPECLADPFWRLSNLYKIRKEGSGDPIPFVLRPEQRLVIESLQNRPQVPLYIIKARRLGLSTGIGVSMADDAIWKAGSQNVLIERSEVFAAKKMNNIMAFAVKSMPKELVERIYFDRDNDSELKIKIKGLDDKFLSSINATVKARGDDCSFLWVSEWGEIAFEDPKRSNEIRSGSLPAARLGKRVVETTWKGGKSGDLWELIQPILEGQPDANGEIMFFPWHGDPHCVRFDGGTVTEEIEQYFRELSEKTGKTFTQEQKRWYTVTSREQGNNMKREFPSAIHECWESPIKGAIYGQTIDTIRGQGQITTLPHNADYPVDTLWDLGAPENTVVWYVQHIAGYDHFIDCDHDLFLTTKQRADHMKAKGYDFNAHYLPHDSAALQRGGVTYREELAQCGLDNVVTVPRTTNVWLGINEVSKLLPYCFFDSEKCKKGIEALERYRRKFDEKSKLLTNDIVHDWSSHFCDAVRVRAESKLAGVQITKTSGRFDREGIERLRISAIPATAAPQVGEAITNETTRGALFRDNPQGWLRRWMPPMPDRSYLLCVRFRDGKLLVGSATRRDTNAMAVLCAEHMDTETREIVPARMVAALSLEDESSPEVTMQRVLALHRLYGSCCVVPIIDNEDNAANRLMQLGVVNLWGPGMGADGSRMTQGKSTETFGWLTKPGLHRQTIDNLDRVVREHKLNLTCTETIKQLTQATLNRDGETVPPSGERDDWLRMLAVGMTCIQFATLYRPHLEGPPNQPYSGVDDGYVGDAHGL